MGGDAGAPSNGRIDMCISINCGININVSQSVGAYINSSMCIFILMWPRSGCAGFVEGNTYRGSLYMAIKADHADKLAPVRRRAIAMTDSKPPANYVLLCEALGP